MKSAVLLLAALALAPAPCLADGPVDILRVYLSASDLVVLGTILNQPEGVYNEAGVPNYLCEFKVEDVLKGNSQLKGKTIKVNIIRFEADVKDHHPLIAKDARCILFLKEEETKRPSWETADFWFGVQHPFPWLVRSLKRASQGSAQEAGERQRRQTLTPEDAVRLLVRDCRARIDGTVPPRSWPEKIRKVGNVWVADIDTSRLPGGAPEQIAVEVTAVGGGTGRPKYAAIAGLRQRCIEAGTPKQLREARRAFLANLKGRYSGIDASVMGPSANEHGRRFSQLMIEWNPLLFKADDLKSIAGKPTRESPDRLEYHFDNGYDGCLWRFTLDVSGTITALEYVAGE